MEKLSPTLQYEKKFWSEGKLVCGIDEVGRGSLAGPLYVAAVVFEVGHKMIKGVNDSKKLTPKIREDLHKKIIEESLCYAIGVTKNYEIDNYGLTLATNIAIERAINEMNIKPDVILMDAFKIDYKKIKALPVKKGDEVCYSISCASIVAKVERDKHISNIPEAKTYRFDKNKGYGTIEHMELIKKHGISDVHRKSFKPIKVSCG